MTCRYRCASLLVMATLSSSCVTCELPTAEEHRTERCMPVGFRPSRQGG
jgi:hypothetical protein